MDAFRASAFGKDDLMGVEQDVEILHRAAIDDFLTPLPIKCVITTIAVNGIVAAAGVYPIVPCGTGKAVTGSRSARNSISTHIRPPNRAAWVGLRDHPYIES